MTRLQSSLACSHVAIMAEITPDDAKTLQESIGVLTSILNRVVDSQEGTSMSLQEGTSRPLLPRSEGSRSGFQLIIVLCN